MVKQLSGTNQNANPLTGIPTASGPTDAVPLAQLTAAITAAINANNLALYPIGAVIGNAAALSANPSTYIPGLAGTTWIPYAPGRSMVGKATSGTFLTAGNTGGAETHTLTRPQMPKIDLRMSHHGDENGSIIRLFTTDGTGSSGGTYINSYKAPPGTSGGAGSIYYPSATWGENQPHNNLQPYIVAHMWERTA